MSNLKRMSSLTNLLPEDVLMNNILLKLDMKSLGKLRCACKYLQSFISSPVFVKMHCHDQFNNNPLVFLVSSNKSVFFSLNFNGTHIKPYCPRVFHTWNPFFFGSCNGLLCLVERENHPPSLWNPTTKEYKQLPPPLSPRSPLTHETPIFLSHLADIIPSGCIGDVAYGLGYDSVIDDYKVIQYESSKYYWFFPPDGPSHVIKYYTIIDFQVYTLGTDTWRRINVDNPYSSYCTTPYHYKTPGMFVNGALHWILIEEKSCVSRIIAFDIEKEMFRAEVPKPHSRLDSSLCYQWSLHVLKGCLCIYERLEHKLYPYIDVWMMKDYGTMESWTKLFTINDYSVIASYGMDFKVLKLCDNGKVIVAGDYGRKGLIVYDPINSESQTINFGEIPGGISYKEIHIESLVSLNTGIYRYGMVENKPSEEIKMKRKRLT